MPGSFVILDVGLLWWGWGKVLGGGVEGGTNLFLSVGTTISQILKYRTSLVTVE